MCWRKPLCALVLVMAAVAAAAAQTPQETVYLYRGADRAQRLADKARAEGALVLYTSLATTESIPLTQAFEKKYGVKVQLWRALSENVLQRTIGEARGGRHSVDVVETNGPEVEALAREKILAEFHSPYIDTLHPWAIPSHRLWISDRADVWVIGFNTQKVRRDELPSALEGFLDPKWKGRIGLEATDDDWMAAIVKSMGEAKGLDFFRRLAATKPEIRKGHVLLAQLIAAGEIPVGLTVYSGNADSIKKKGGPMDWVAIDPVVGRPQGLGLAKNAPHPNAALLFADFVLSPEGAALLQSLGREPASRTVKTVMDEHKTIMVDPVTMADEADKWRKIWDGLFGK